MIAFGSGQAAQRNAGIVGLISVELLLLSFFILLISLSTFEQHRTKSVMESVQDAFNGAGADSSVDGRDHRTSPVELAIELARVASEIPLARFASSADSEMVYLDLPLAGFFWADDSKLKPHMLGFFDRLKTILAEAAGKRVYEIAFLQGGNPPTSLQLRRAGELAQTWIARGGQSDSVAVGFSRGDPAWLRILIGRGDEGHASR